MNGGIKLKRIFSIILIFLLFFNQSGQVTAVGGDLNADIDISPQNSVVLSGNDAVYKLVVKFTGSTTTYTNAKIVVNLPITSYTSFTQDVNELMINGVAPTYDATNHTLTYQFAKLKTGQSYETLIKVDTQNGISPNDAQLTATASFQATEQPLISDSATMNIQASNTITMSKKFLGMVESGKVPSPGTHTIWEIKVDIPKKDIGQMYIDPGRTIVVTDTLPAGLTYSSMNQGPVPTISGNKLTWTFPPPSLTDQANASTSLFSTTLRVVLTVASGTAGTTQTNTATTNATFIDNKVASATASGSVQIYTAAAATGDITGTVYDPAHYGPLDGTGTISNDKNNKDPNPLVYDNAYLGFSHGVTAMQEGKTNDFQAYETRYNIDPNLILDKIVTPGGWIYAPTTDYWDAKIPLKKDPVFNIYATVNGVEKLLVTNAVSGKTYTRADLGLTSTDKVSRIRYDYTYAPAGMVATKLAKYYFNVVKGYVGTVTNTFNVLGTDSTGATFNRQFYLQSGSTDFAGPRHATIGSRPTTPPPIATVSVELTNQNAGEVIPGTNWMSVTLTNTTASPTIMNKPLETVVLLPLGVTINTNITPTLYYADSYQILSDNYNGSGRQLVKINWAVDRLLIGDSLKGDLPVTISDIAPNTLKFDVWGFSGDAKLAVPSGSGAITDTILQTDTNDLNNDGVTNEPRIKSGNIYTLSGKYDIQTEKLVKGELDSGYSYFGQTVPGGTIDYLVKLTNTTGKVISNLTLIDVLPSVGDLGITDNVERGSMFTPIMTNSIVLPPEWEGKVNVYYSTATNPQRDELTQNTMYPTTTTQLINSTGAQPPNWMTADQVTDWSLIHSFKIEMKPDVDWIKGDNITIQFRMQAPLVMDPSILDPTVDPQTRAAWNSFAVATDYGQPVEPARVGVYMTQPLSDIKITKRDKVTKDLLPGAEFELRKCSAPSDAVGDCTVVTSDSTDANGQLIFKDLTKGFYKIIETKAPAGYRLLTKPIDVEVTNTSQVIPITVENEKTSWELPKSGGIGSTIFYIMGTVLMSLVALHLLSRKRATK